MISSLPCLARIRRYRQARFARRDLVNIRYFRERWRWKEEVGGISYAIYCSDRYELEQWERKLAQRWEGTRYYHLIVLEIERAYRDLERARSASKEFHDEPKPTRITYKSDRQLEIEAAFAKLGLTYVEDAQVWVETNKDGVSNAFVPVSHEQLVRIQQLYPSGEIAVFAFRKSTKTFDIKLKNASDVTVERMSRILRTFYSIDLDGWLLPADLKLPVGTRP